MSILEFKIIENFPTKDGLKPRDLKRLEKVVLLVGPNGGGKTRILKRLEQTLLQIPNISINLQQATQQLKELENAEKKERFISGIPSPKSALEEVSLRIKNLENMQSSVILKQGAKIPVPIFIVPKGLRLTDPSSFTPDQIDQNSRIVDQMSSRTSSNMERVDMTNLDQYCMSKILKIVQDFRHFTHQDNRDLDPKRRESAITEFHRLNKFVKELLGDAFDLYDAHHLRIFQRKFNAGELSDGQKILIQYAVEMLVKGVDDGDQIILMDEPENHIQPSVLIEVFDRLHEMNQAAQFWVASHSVHLAAHVPESSVFYVEDGCAEYAGTRPDYVIRGLVGNADKIVDFLRRPDELALIRFSADCVVPPRSVSTGSDDPQLIQIRDTITEHNEEEVLRVLDFGAGSGRLLAALDELGSERKVDYVGYDPAYATNLELFERVNAISKQVGHNRLSTRFTHELDFNTSFDVVIVCNVLHEIPFADWHSVFAKTIAGLIENEGHCLIVEDLGLPHGEAPTKEGFILLHPPSHESLFRNPDLSPQFRQHNGNKERLMALLVTRDDVLKVSPQSVADAMKSLITLSKDKIEVIRSGGLTDYATGRLLAMWLQEFATCTIAYEKITKRRA